MLCLITFLCISWFFKTEPCVQFCDFASLFLQVMFFYHCKMLSHRLYGLASDKHEICEFSIRNMVAKVKNTELLAQNYEANFVTQFLASFFSFEALCWRAKLRSESFTLFGVVLLGGVGLVGHWGNLAIWDEKKYTSLNKKSADA